jgi:hypothetical protein
MTESEMIALGQRIAGDLASVGLGPPVMVATEADGRYLFLDIFINGAQIGRVCNLAEYEAQLAAARARVAHA